jgi:hypothetical protein
MEHGVVLSDAASGLRFAAQTPRERLRESSPAVAAPAVRIPLRILLKHELRGRRNFDRQPLDHVELFCRLGSCATVADEASVARHRCKDC